MAVTGNPGKVLKFSAQGDAFTGRLMVSYMRWVGATTLAHTLVVKDTSGVVWWESIADGAAFIDILPLFKMIDGVSLDTMGSGALYVYTM